MDNKTECECPLAGYCNRHKIEKTSHLHKLCQSHPKYFQMWEECRGPGQQNVTCGDVQEKPKEIVPVKEEPVPQLPSIITQAKNLAVATKAHIKNGMRTVTPEKKAARLAICEVCPKLIKSSMRCAECGCMLNTKTEWESSTCPLRKW